MPAPAKLTRTPIAATPQPASHTDSSKHRPPVPTRDTGKLASHPSAGRARVVPAQLSTDERKEVSEIGGQQGSNYSGGVMGTIMSFITPGGVPPPKAKDKHQTLEDEVQSERDNYKGELHKAHGEMRSANHRINELQNELKNVHQQLEEAKALSKARGKKLVGAQVFSTKADTLTISEVGEKVTALNEKIFEAAAMLGEALTHRRHDLPQDELKAAAAESQEMVGEKISSLLISQKPEPEINPILVQVVLQIFIVNFCVSKIRSWYPSDSTIAEFLGAIYSEIRLTEEQAISGRWRVLTRAHTRPSTETWTKELCQKLMSILKIAAWTPGSAENQESFRQRLPPIFKAISELRIAIGEIFTSADLDISVFSCDMTYQPLYMEDVYGDSEQQPNAERAPDIVVGTTGIGLKKLMAERGANDALQFQNVISAKILLESTLREILQPVQSPGSLRRKKRKPVENTGVINQDGCADHVPAATTPSSKDELRRVQHELDNYKRELQRTREEVRKANDYINELHQENLWKDGMDSVQNELKNVHQQSENAQNLAEVRGKELFGAVMLTISEVGEKVASLNEKILQAATTLGEGLIPQRYDLPQSELDAAATETKEMVGEKISNLLISQAQKSELGLNAILVQVVLRIFMVKFCVSKIQSWHPSDSSTGRFLIPEIHPTEEQSVSGRWRALTRAHTKPSTGTWLKELSQKLRSVLKTAAWNPGSPENQESFRRHLPSIFKAVNELRIAIGEDITSADLHISIFDCDAIYEPLFMENAYGDGRQHSGNRAPAIIAGTIGIGLMKLMAERSTNGDLQFQNVISAKIVLESTLKEALELVESSGRPKRKKKPTVENIDGADGHAH